jgi:hypothetical protein
MLLFYQPAAQAASQPWLPYVRYLPYAIVALVLLRVFSRNLRPRPMRPELLWIYPVILLIGVGAFTFTQRLDLTFEYVALMLVSLVLGAALGWWRGATTRMTVDPATHAVTVQASPLGMVLLLGIIGLRYLMRPLLAQNATLLHLSLLQVTDGLMLLAAAMLSAQRLELWLRARSMRAEIGAPTGAAAGPAEMTQAVTPQTNSNDQFPPTPPIVS